MWLFKETQNYLDKETQKMNALQTVDQETWKTFVAGAVMLLSYFGGQATVPLINKLKTWLSWSGRKVMWLTAVVAGTLGLLTVVATGAVAPSGTITPEWVALAFITVLGSAKIEYDRIRSEQTWKVEIKQ